MRKAFTKEPLWRINEPLRRISEPLRWKTERPLWRIIRPSCAIIEPPRRIRVYSFTEAVEGKPKHFQDRHEPAPPYKNIEPVHEINKDFGGNENANKFQVARGCQTVACKFYNGRETIDMKAVVNHSQSSSVINSDKCNK